MGLLRSLAANIGAGILAAMVAFAPPTARADGCTPDDLWNALSNVASAVTSPACDAAYSEGV